MDLFQSICGLIALVIISGPLYFVGWDVLIKWRDKRKKDKEQEE